MTIRFTAVLATAFALFAAMAQAQPIDDTPRIAVLSAFHPELASLLEAVEEPQSHIVNNVTFTTGKLEGKDAVLFLSGISMTNAAMTVQMALDHFEIEAIVYSGIAGGVDPSLNIGDVVVAERWAPYLDVFIARETADGEYVFPPFFKPQMPNFGPFFPRGVSVFDDGFFGDELRFWFAADAKLLDVAAEVAETVSLEDCVEENGCLSQPPQIVVGGNGVSGSAFVDNAAFRAYTFETFEAQVLDMETAAVAQVATTNETPFIAFRSLSDLAGGGDGENEIGTFFGLAAKNSAAVVRAFLRAL